MKSVILFITSCLLSLQINAQCSGTVTLAGDTTIIDVNTSASYSQTFSTATGNPNELKIQESVVIPSGTTLIIKGDTNTRFSIIVLPGREFVVQKGGTFIIEYCDLKKGGTCPTVTYDTWDGIRVHGDSSKTHYAPYDFTGGWDPYAPTFKPWGTYRVIPGTGHPAHGRLQMRWCTVKGIEREGNKGGLDDVGTTHIEENKYGNYAIRSKNGGILDIVDTDFEKVRIAISIENYELLANWRLPRAMNAFNIIDCDFKVTSAERSLSKDKFENCIYLNGAQRVSIEGCTFTSADDEEYNYERGIALFAENSSFFIHKSGNFRRDIDVNSGGETNKNCLLYGNEQSDLGDYPSNHPWKKNSPRETKFSYFYYAIDFDGSSAAPKSYMGIDDAQFNHCFYSIRMKKCMSGTITRCKFTYRESSDKHDLIDATWNDIFTQGHGFSVGDFTGIGQRDRYDISARKSMNLVISENTFSSDFDGDVSHTQKNVYIVINSQFDGEFLDSSPKRYIYDLVHKNTFSPEKLNQDVGIWMADQNDRGDDYKSWTLLNCNSFEDLKNAVYIDLSTTQLIDQFNHKDMQTGRNASAGNIYTNNICNFQAHSSNTLTFNYYYNYGGTAPSDCSGNLIGVSAGAGEDEDCSSLDCTEFPMINNGFEEAVDNNSELSIYPNPSNGSININFNPNRGYESVLIYTIDGKIISTINVATDKSTIEYVMDVPKGVYFISILSSENIVTRKIIIQN